MQATPCKHWPGPTFHLDLAHIIIINNGSLDPGALSHAYTVYPLVDENCRCGCPCRPQRLPPQPTVQPAPQREPIDQDGQDAAAPSVPNTTVQGIAPSSDISTASEDTVDASADGPQIAESDDPNTCRNQPDVESGSPGHSQPEVSDPQVKD